MYITKETLAQALLDLKGTAHPLLKVWLTIKAMGLEAGKPVLIDTKNSTETLKLLFHSGDPSGRFYIPFSPTPSDEWMKGDASRSIIQTTIKKWFDGTITTVDPRSYLTITRADRKYKIELAPSYPQGLGDGQNGFSRGEGQMLAVPIVQFAVWVFCREAIPDDTANVAEYLCSKLRNLLHLSSAEESRVFKDTTFAISTSEKALTDANIFELCGGSAGMSNINCGWCDEYLAAIRTKPFILLAGISGTGKSRIVRQLARGCCPEMKDGQPHPLRDEQKPGNFELIPVRPNWHDSTELMGYVTRVTGTGNPKYVLTPFVKFLVKAWLHKNVPFFLCLDEMNLAPVEQYFAEYLSKIESRKLSDGDIVTDVLVEFPDEILDSVLSEISRELPLVATTKQMDGDAKPATSKRDKDSLYKLWDEFLADWPISRLREMGLEEYTKAGSADTFTYALEAKLAKLGSIWGGSAFKFGIFSRDPNGKLKDYSPNSKQIGTSEYAWYRKFGLTKDAAWNTVKEKIVLIAEAAASGNFAAVDKIDFPHVVKWKIAFLYQDRKNIKIVDIFKREWILLLTAGMPQNASFAERYLKLNEERRSMDVFEWDDNILTKRRAELLAADDDFDSDEEEESTPADAWIQSPVLAMIKRDKGIRIPPNLVVMGTVNMDETTCSFSRKVLDRAMSFELNDVEDMYTISTDGDPNVAWGAFNVGGVNRTKQTYVTAENLYAEADATKKAANMAIGEKVLAYLKAINAVLDKTPFKVAYRTRNEMMLYCVERGGDLAKALDEVTSMKILSRIEGDENAVRVTNKLVESAAVVPTPLPNNAPKNLILLLKLVILKQLGVVDGTVTNAAVAPSAQEYETLEGKYKICAAKLDEMNDRLLSGYTGFWR